MKRLFLFCSLFFYGLISHGQTPDLSEQQVREDFRRCWEALQAGEERQGLWLDMEESELDPEDFTDPAEVQIETGYFSTKSRLEAVALLSTGRSNPISWGLKNSFLCLYECEEGNWELKSVAAFYMNLIGAEDINGDGLDEVRTRPYREGGGRFLWENQFHAYRDGEWKLLYSGSEFSFSSFYKEMETGEVWNQIEVGDTLDHFLDYETAQTSQGIRLKEMSTLSIALRNPDGSLGLKEEQSEKWVNLNQDQ